MQYPVSVIDDTPNSATSDEMTDIDAFNDGLQAGGYWVFAGGLGAPSTATVIDGRGAEPIFTDGPFVETKDIVNGFAVIEARDLAQAAELAKGCPILDVDGSVEIRPIAAMPAMKA